MEGSDSKTFFSGSQYSVPVYCYNCGHLLGGVNSRVAGRQDIGCPKCGKKTGVIISKSGEVKTGSQWWV